MGRFTCYFRILQNVKKTKTVSIRAVTLKDENPQTLFAIISRNNLNIDLIVSICDVRAETKSLGGLLSG